MGLCLVSSEPPNANPHWCCYLITKGVGALGFAVHDFDTPMGYANQLDFDKVSNSRSSYNNLYALTDGARHGLEWRPTRLGLCFRAHAAQHRSPFRPMLPADAPLSTNPSLLLQNAHVPATHNHIGTNMHAPPMPPRLHVRIAAPCGAIRCCWICWAPGQSSNLGEAVMYMQYCNDRHNDTAVRSSAADVITTHML